MYVEFIGEQLLSTQERSDNFDSLHDLIISIYVYLYSMIDQAFDSLKVFAVDEPILFLSIVVIALSLIGIFIIKIKEYLRSPSDWLLLELDKHDTVTVLMHENPDPDAMASALGIERLASIVNTEVELVYPGEIRHHENRAFRAVLDVTFDSLSHADEIKGDTILLVDHHEPRGFLDAEEITPNIVIDHHAATQVGEIKEEAEFWHVESDIGACATVITEFFNQQDISLTTLDGKESNSISETLATALFYGIMSDTKDLTQGVTNRDYRAAMALYDGANRDSLHRISSPKIDANALETRARAIMSRDVRGAFAVSDVGNADNPDAIPQAADELVQLEGVSAVLVFGTCEESIRMSGRAYDDRVHMGEVIRTAMEDIPKASAGGHSEMGGGFIPKAVFDYSEVAREDLVERFFDAMNGEH